MKWSIVSHAARRGGIAALGFLAIAASAAARVLPAEVEQALRKANVPQDALVVVLQDAGSTSSRLSWQPQLPVNPASLTKLITTYAALDLFGPAWSWTTPVWLQGKVDSDGVLDGNLVIKGSGDPKLVQERLWLLLRRVQQAGVREIRGDIVLDRSAFDVPEQSAADFDGEPLKPYNVRPDALMLNYKSLVLTFTPDIPRGVATVGADPTLAGFRVDTTVPLVATPCDDWRGALKPELGDPATLHFNGSYALACGEKQWPLAFPDAKGYNARVLEGMWAEMGGRLGGKVREGIAPPITPSFEVSSPPLAELIRDINKYSNNMMAQQLFLTMGMVFEPSAHGVGTPEAGRQVLHRWLIERLGDSAGETVIDNGSGLSRETRISAQTLARLLQLAWSGPLMPELMSSLPVSGIDGTLVRSRAPQGRAHLKTGSLRDVVGIAGYVLGNSGRRQVLVAIINHPNAGAARPVLDALVHWAAQDQRRAD